MIARYAKVFLIVLSAPALGEGLCQSKNLSKSERIVCDNVSLRMLDKKLNEVYSVAYRMDSHAQSLKTDQLHWLKHERDKCDSDTCMSDAYENRIFFLGQKIEANKKLNDQPLAKAEYAEVCNGIAALASDKKLQSYKIIGVNSDIVRNSVKKVWGDTKDIDRFGLVRGFDAVQEIYNIKISNSARAKKFIRYVASGSCSTDKIYPMDYLTNSDKDYSGRVSVGGDGNDFESSGWGLGEFPVYYGQRNYIIAGDMTGPRMVSLIQSDGQILPLCLLAKTSTSLVVAESKDKDKDQDKDKDKDKELCAGVASGSIKPQLWKNQYIADKVEEAELINMSEARGRYGISIFLPLTSEKQNELSQAFVKFVQDSGAGCGSHVEWLRRTVLANNTLKIRFDDPLFAGKDAERVEVYFHNEKHYIGYFPSWEISTLYHFENDTLTKTCEFEKNPEFTTGRIF